MITLENITNIASNGCQVFGVKQGNLIKIKNQKEKLKNISKLYFNNDRFYLFTSDDCLNIFDKDLSNVLISFSESNYPSHPFYTDNNNVLIKKYSQKNVETQVVINKKFEAIKITPPYYNFILNNYILYSLGTTLFVLNYRSLNSYETEILQYTKDSNNKIEGKLIGYEDTLIVPLKNGEILGLNTRNGSLKWKLEFDNRQEFISQNNEFLYAYNRDTIWEIAIENGKIIRGLNTTDIYIDKYNDWPNKSLVSNGKLIIEFLKTDNSLLVIDLEKFDLESSIICSTEAFLKVREGDVLWHKNQLYARDPISNTLYVFGDELLT